MDDAVTVDHRGDTRLVRLHGELDLQSEPLLRAGLSSQPDPTARAVIIDLGAVTFLDCAAVNLLLGLARRCAADEVGLLVADVPAKVRRVLVALDLDHAFTLVRDEAEALVLASLWDGDPAPADPESPLAAGARRDRDERDGRQRGR